MDKFSDLLGKTLSNVEVKGKEEIIFTLNDGKAYKLFHEQDCCENVEIEDVVGELSDLIGSPILMADEATNNDIPGKDDPDSHTWTFYKLATIKGYVTIRWYGVSNGYYGESVDFEEIATPFAKRE